MFFSIIEYLPDEKCFFILNPFDVIKAESRDYDDHIDFLIGKNKFTEAIEAFEHPKSSTQRARRHNKQVILIFSKYSNLFLFVEYLSSECKISNRTW